MSNPLWAFVISAFVLLTSVSQASRAAVTSPQPEISLGRPGSAFAGNTVCVSAVLTNRGEPGYGPYYRLITDELLTVHSVTALGESIDIEPMGIFSEDNSQLLTESRSNTDVTGSIGQALALASLPIGSVVAGGPALNASICLTIDSAAPMGEPLHFSVQPVYEYGDSATGDNGAIIGTTEPGTVIPAVFSYGYQMYAAESERVPGAPFNISFSHGVNIATGQTITDLSIQQSLGSHLVFDQLTSAVPDNCSLTQPAQGEADGVLHLTCPSATGSASSNDIGLTHTGYIGDVLATNSCATLAVTSSSEAQANFNATALTPVSAGRHITAKHLTVQQSASPSRVNPGDVITITDTIRTTAYGNTSELIVTDTLPDGLEFVNNLTAPSDGAPLVSADGKTITHVLLSGSQPAASPASTFSVSYQVRVLQTYANGNEVLASDSLGVSSQITYSLAQGATACNDTSATTVSVSPVSTAISILPDDNGQLKAEYQPGDKVTFRLSMAIPSGDSNAIKFINYLPLPVFNVANFSKIYDDQSLSSQDKVTWFSADGQPKVAATVDYNIAENALIIDWGDVTGTQAQTLAVDIEATIVSEPFADGLNLTNLFSSTSQNTPGQTSSSLRNVSLLVRAPELVAVLTDDSATQVDAGDTLSYQLQITNEGGATAYDIAAEVAAVVGLDDAVLGSVIIDNVATTNTTGSFATNDFTVNDPLAPGSIMVISFTRNVAADVTPQQNITAASSTVWASNTGATKFPALSATQSLFVGSPEVSTAVVSVSPQPAAPDVVVGDLVSYVATITLPEGHVSDLVLDAVLPAGFEYSMGSAQPAIRGYAGTLASAPVVTTAGAVATGQQVTMTFSGTTITNADNNPANNSFRVAFDARVTNHEANAAALVKQDKSLQTAVTFAGFSGPDIDATVAQQFAEHNLSMSTAISPSTALSAGDEITVTLTVENTGTAAAHDVSVTSMVDENLLDTASVTAGPAIAAGYGFNKVGNTITFNGSAAPLAVGQSLVFSYTGTVVADVQSGSSFDLPATAQGDSQPGTVDLQREQTQSLAVIAQSVNPTVTTLSPLTTTESWTAAGELPELAIGEVVTYGVKMAIPEGRTVGKPGQFVLIGLPEGLTYIESSATVREISDTGLSSTTHTPLAASNTPIDPTVGRGELAFDLGTVTNTDNDRNNEYMVVTFELLVTNTSANLRGASKAVQASINYLNQAGSAQAHQQSSYSLIVAPLLLMTLDADKTTFSGGEAMTYTLVASNSAQSGASRAWDWGITENLPSRLAYQGLTSATLSRGNQDISACVTQANNEIIVTSSCLTDNRERYLAPGESITIIYTAQADASIGFEEPVESLATFTATSLPGEQGTGNAAPGIAGSARGERTGLPADNSEAQAVNNLVATGRETIRAGAPAVSLAGSSSALLIGESFTYTMDLGIPTGTTDAFSVTLTLPTGVRYTGNPIEVAYPASDFSTSQTPATSQPAGTNPLILQFDSVVNSAGLGQTVAITIPVQTQNILTSQEGVTLTTATALDYARVSDPAPSDSTSIIIREADLEVSQTILSGDVNSDAGDKIRYRTIVLNQSASAPAHQVVLTDVMPQELLGGNPAAANAVFSNITLTSTGTVGLNGTDTAVNQNNVQIITTNHPNDTLTLPALSIAANSSLVLEYDVYVDATAQAGQTLLNTVSATYNSLSDSSSNTGRDHSDGADDNDNSVLNNYNSVTASELTLNSAVSVQTTLDANKHPVSTFTIGEAITLDLRVGVVEGQVSALNVQLDMPTGVRFEEAAVSVPGQINYTGVSAATVDANNQVKLNLGEVTNSPDNEPANDFFMVSVTGVIENSPGTQSGDLLGFTGRASGNSVLASPSNLEVTVIEPALNATLEADKNAVTLGDVVTFTFTATPAAGSSNAYDTGLVLALPTGLTLEADSFAGSGMADESQNGVLAVNLGTMVATEGALQFSFNARVDSDAAIDSALSVTTQSASFSSLAAAKDDERIYSFSVAETIAADDASFISADQSMLLTYDANGNGQVDAADELTINTTITNNGFDAPEFEFFHRIPASTAYKAGTAQTSAGVLDDSAGIRVTQETLAENQILNISFVVTVNDTATPGSFISAQGRVDSAATVSEPTDADANDANGDQANRLRISGREGEVTATISQQQFSLTHDADNDDRVSAGDTLTFRYTLTNNGTVDLTNMAVQQPIPAGLSYVNGSAVLPGADSVAVSANMLTGELAVLPAGASVVLSFAATIDDIIPTTTSRSFLLQGRLSSNETGSRDFDANGIAADGSQPLQIFAVGRDASAQPAVELTQSWYLKHDVDGDGMVDNGDEITFILQASNYGSGAASQVVVTQSYPDNTRYVQNSAQVSQGAVGRETPSLLANLGNLAPGAVASVSYTLRVDGPDNNFVIDSQASVSGSNFSTLSADDNSNVADGRNPLLVQVTDALTPALIAASQITATSDKQTTGTDIVQGETVTLEYTLDVPVGSHEQVSAQILLPENMPVISATLARDFDTGLRAALNPGEINAQPANTSVNVDVIQTIDTATVELGGIINSDNDVNAERFVLTLELDSSSLVPAAAQNPYNITPAVWFVDALGNQVQLTQNPVSFTLLNQVPVVFDDAFTIAEDSLDQVLDVLSNDSDADNGQQLTLISLQTAGVQGTALISPDETKILFTPTADLFGEQTLTYLVADTAGAQVSGNVTITITPVDDAPVAVADTLQVTEDSSALVNVINNDYDVDNPGEALVIVNATASTGTVTVEGDSLRYTPNPDFAGNTVIHYDVQDTTGRTTGGQVNVTVANINDAPVVVDDTAVATEDTLMILDILANDIDADNDILQLTSLSSAQGQASVSQDGELRFMPSQDFNGPATISYVVSDGVGGKTAAQLHFDVTPVNDVPVLSPIPLTTFVNEPVIIHVFAHTIDVDGDTLQLASSSATNGVISTGAGGRLTFTPLTDYDGPAEARVCVSDGTEQSCGVWNITVAVPNTAPVLQDLTVEIGEDQSITMALHGVDADGDLLTYTLLTEPKGKLAGTMPVSTYTPPQNFDGEDHFTYVASDGQYSSNEATVTIVIGSENDAPVAIDDVVLTNAYGQQTIDVLANDSDPEDDKLTIVGATASLGTVSWSESQLFYSPVAGFVGTTVLTYTIKDTAGQSASARVLVTVEPASNGLLPVIKVPADITIDADALFTKVDLGMASAVDRFGNPLPVSLMGGSSFYEPGMNIAYWVAIDKEGRQSIASQRVRVNPMVSLDKDKTVLEGHSISVNVHLNGAAPAYPVVIPFQVSGTATDHDHDLISGEVVIESGTTGTLRFTAFADGIEDANETIVVSLNDNLNRSNQFEQVIQIAETNIDPALTLRSVQQGEQRLVVSRQGGPVQINALLQHPEADTAHDYTWLAQETKLIDIDDSPTSFTFEPATLATGFYEVSLEVTNSADNAFGATGNIVLQVVEGFKELTGVDSDQDGISDVLEGYRDHNVNGIADFVDRLSNCSVLPQTITVLDQYLLEADPGVCLRLGKTARMGQTGGAQVLEQDIGALNDLIADAIAQNMGGLFDFVAYGLPRKGQVVNIVIPQLRPVPENAVYRKYKHQQLWFDFVQDDHNRVWSAAGEPGYCPAPGSGAWTPGLTAGHWCVQLTIMDGGPNDADGIANTTVVDPGGVGVVIGDPNMLPETNEDRYEVLLTKPTQFTPLANDTDANGDALVITSASASLGEVIFNNDTVFYTPPAGFVGKVEITYGVADERGGTAAGIMSIKIVANKAPLVTNETADVASGSRITVNVLSNDSDPDGDALTVVSAQAQSGTVFILDSGALEYVPRADFTGQDKITYIVADTNFAEAKGQLTVTVHPVAVRVEIKGGGAVVGLLLLMLGAAGGRQAERAWRRSRP